VTSPVAIVIRCGDLVRHVYTTLTAVKKQTIQCEIVTVVDASTPRSALPWIASLADESGALFVVAGSPHGGVVKNAGIERATAKYIACVDAGDLLAVDFAATGSDALATDPRARVVSSAVQMIGVAEPSHTITHMSPDVGVLGNPDGIHSASMFRRDDWLRLGGFDEALPALDHYEFWLRLVSSAPTVAWVDRPLLIRGLRKDSFWYREGAEHTYLAAMTSICRKHEALFRQHAADVLYSRERTLTNLGRRYSVLIAEHDRTLEEMHRLRVRRDDLRRQLSAAPGSADVFEDLRRTMPVDRDWGYTRGTPIDRYYIEAFLQSCASDIAGRVLEVQEPDYTNRFGAARVTQSDVVDIDSDNWKATVITDLRRAANIPSGRYDCIILTQTLHVIDDMRAAVGECCRMLRPGGVLLATLPSTSRLCLEYGPAGDFWRVTEAGARATFDPFFSSGNLDIRSYGNVLSNTAFLHGLAVHELTPAELDARDPFFPLVIGVRAKKADRDVVSSPVARRPAHEPSALVLLYHRVSEAPDDLHEIAVTPDAFREHMAYVREHCHPLPLDELVTLLREQRVPDRAVAVTFDDGYSDNYTAARPALEEFEIPATLFFPTERIDDEQEFWWDVLAHALLSAAGVPSELQIELPEGPRRFSTSTKEQRLETHWSIYHAIVTSPADDRDRIVENVRNWSRHALSDRSVPRRMSGAMLREFARSPRLTIGAHSVRHEMLSRQPAATQQREICQSREHLEQLLERKVTAFAYPFGAYSAETLAAAAAASLDLAVTCDEWPLGTETDPLRIPRWMVTHRRSAYFASWLASIFRH
jgi:peptidoglycan/xylan/chitin deacetylase (PgdA/CDA1 family)